MSLLLQILLLGILSALLKFTTRIWRGLQFTWFRAFGYVLLVMLAIALAVYLTAGTSMPFPLVLLLGAAVHTLLGGLYLGRFASTSSGNHLGFRGGAFLAFLYTMLLVLIYVALLAAVTLIPGFLRFRM